MPVLIVLLESTGNMCKHQLNKWIYKDIDGFHTFILKRKSGVWLKILEDQADLVPIPIKASRMIYTFGRKKLSHL